MRRANILPIAVMVGAVVAFLVVGYFALPTKLTHRCKLIGVRCTQGYNYDKYGCFTGCTHSAVDANKNSVTNINGTTNSNANIDSTSNTNTSFTTNWKTYTNTTYGYTIKYPNDYVTTSSNPGNYSFQKGDIKGPIHLINVLSLTAANHTDLESSEFSGHTGWYDWAMSGFAKNGSVAAGLSQNKRTETYGKNSFTVINYDAASSWNGEPFYYLVKDATVFLIMDDNEVAADPNIIKLMLASFSYSDPTADWKTYMNTVIGYSLKYPTGWVVKEINEPNSVVLDTPFRYLTLTDPSSKYQLAVGVRKIGSTVALSDRTGVGAGDITTSSSSVLIGTTSVTPRKNVYLGKTKDVFYYPSSEAWVVLSGDQVRAEFGAINQSYDVVNLATAPELSMANTILSTIEITK